MAYTPVDGSGDAQYMKVWNEVCSFIDTSQISLLNMFLSQRMEKELTLVSTLVFNVVPYPLRFLQLF